MNATRLRTEYLKEPMGIDVQHPRLRWNCVDGVRQTAYQVVCQDEKGIAWESGRVNSDSMEAVYPHELNSRERICWRVRLWDEKEEAGDWKEGSFEMGLLHETDWKAAWITGNYQVNKKQRYPVDCFRKKFTAPAGTARLYMTACGLYEAVINGKRVGSFVMAPGHTDYRKRVFYQTYDVTGLLRAGENTIEIQLADGWYRGSCGAWGLRNQYGIETKVIAQLEVDGKAVLCTDDTWDWSNDGPVRLADNQDGEIYDARRTPTYSGKAKETTHNVVPAASNNVPVVERACAHVPDERRTSVMNETGEAESTRDVGLMAAAMADEILKKMTLEDKIALCSGASFWQTKAMEKYGIPDLFMCDGPHGLRKQENVGDMLGVNESLPATCFPTAVTTGASWDVSLMERVGRAIGAEAAACGVGLVLGPGANIKRDPKCGRNFEYFSEDPYVTGKMAAGLIRGLQENGTSASLKHFACNQQEFSRFNSDSVLDERTLREIYLTGFEIAVREGKPDTMMCAYPKINGIHCSDDRRLLTDILRNEWGFDGMVVTDWGAMNDRIEGFRAGCDLNMPGGSEYMEKEVLAAVQAGTLPEAAVDDSTRRVLELVLRTANREAGSFDMKGHHTLAREAAEQGAVLLKNEDNILPLREGQKVVLIGNMAKNPRYQGSGSSHINPFKVVSATDAMPDCAYASGCDEKGNTNDTMIAGAIAAAKAADAAVVFAGLPGQYESEGFDRDHLAMPDGHLRLIEAVTKANPNTVVVLTCGCVVECPWADSVKAILYMGLPGQAGGEAIANLLYGRVNPGGKLTESWPYTYADCPTSGCYGTKDAQYREGIYVGYRYYDKADVKVRWPFGYGLSYTTFAYSNLRVEGDRVTVAVTNTGKVAGAEVVQVYIASHTAGLHRPVRELKGFQKIFLKPQESAAVSFTLSDRSFAVWDNGWRVPAGSYDILVGSLCVSVHKEGVDIPAPAWQPGSWYEAPNQTPAQAEWERMLGRKYTETVPIKGSFTMDNSVMEMKDQSLIMNIMYKAVESTVAKGFDGKKDYSNPEFRMMMASSAGGPLRGMQISGGIKGGLFKGLLHMANGHYMRGIRTMITGKG
ncbi:MAG: glycoside hydrolase family 3 C-terminal domain-containing protein [Lachnospiraceae bacterium]|nr:glycoside hydrolase family 3 C-terminal domain-containing protein [Lachnospiraceae bacterium]